MMKARTATAFAAATMIAVGLSGCSAPADDGTTTISFWTHTHPPMIAVYEDLIAEYEAANHGITIDYQTVPNSDFGTRLLTALSNDSGPDIINMDDGAIRGDYLPSDLLAPIDPAALGEDSVDGVVARYVDGALDGATGSDGQIYGLPSEFNGSALAINVAHFEEAGIDPDAVELDTWEDVKAVGADLALAGHPQAFSFLYLHSLWYAQQLQTLLHQTGGTIADGDEGTLDSPESLEALALWADLATGPDRVADPNVTSREATTPFQDLSSGVQSMGIVYPWAMAQIAETNPDTYANLRVVPLPQVDPAQPTSRVYAYYWSVNKSSSQQEESWKFVNFLSENSDAFLTGTDFVQPLIDWDQTSAAQEIPFIDVWGESYAVGRFDQVTDHYAEVQDVIQNMVNDVVFDGIDSETAAAEASASITRILQG